jgi:hypothetical protein
VEKRLGDRESLLARGVEQKEASSGLLRVPLVDRAVGSNVHNDSGAIQYLQYTELEQYPGKKPGCWVVLKSATLPEVHLV